MDFSRVLQRYCPRIIDSGSPRARRIYRRNLHRRPQRAAREEVPQQDLQGDDQHRQVDELAWRRCFDQVHLEPSPWRLGARQVERQARGCAPDMDDRANAKQSSMAVRASAVPWPLDHPSTDPCHARMGHSAQRWYLATQRLEPG